MGEGADQDAAGSGPNVPRALWRQHHNAGAVARFAAEVGAYVRSALGPVEFPGLRSYRN
jgi:hypothetical protein